MNSPLLSTIRETSDRLHRESLVVLSYVTTHARILPDGRVNPDAFLEDAPTVQCSLPLLQRGGVNAILLSFGIGAEYAGKAGVGRMFQLLANFLDLARRRGDALEVADGAGDVERIADAGKIAVMLHASGVRVDGDLSALEGYRRLGVRAMKCPFDDRHPRAGDVVADRGRLTPFGREAVKALDEMGVLVDISHSSDDAAREILDIVRGPVIASHSNCRALCDVPRNMPDELIEAVGRKGGVIGVHFASGFIRKEYMDRLIATGFHEKLREWEAELHRQYPNPDDYMAARICPETWENSPLRALQQSVDPPPLSDLVDHVDRIVELAGADHVGVGTDYSLGSIPRELDPADKMPNLTFALLERGYSEEDARKVLGGNFLRVFA